MQSLEKKFFSRSFIMLSKRLLSHHQQLLTILLQIKLINLRKISHNLVSQNDFMNCRLSNKKIIQQMWKNINEKRSKSSKSLKACLKKMKQFVFSLKRTFSRNWCSFSLKKYYNFKSLNTKKSTIKSKKQIHEKFQTLKQSSFKNQIEIWVTN